MELGLRVSRLRGGLWLASPRAAPLGTSAAVALAGSRRTFSVSSLSPASAVPAAPVDGSLVAAWSATPRRTVTARCEVLGRSSAAAAATLGLTATAGARRTLFGQAFDIPTIHAVRRSSEDTGTGKSRKARLAGLVPGLVYGKGGDGKNEYIPIWVRERDLAREYNARAESFENTLFDVVLGDQRIRVLPRQLEVHPVQPRAMSVCFMRYVPNSRPGARVSVPIKAINQDRCDALRKGGWMLDLVYKLPVFATGERIPDFALMDVRGKQVGDKIMSSELILGEGIRIRHPQKDFAVAKFVGSRRTEAEDAAKAAAAGGEKGAAPAKGGGGGGGGAAAKKGKKKDEDDSVLLA